MYLETPKSAYVASLTNTTDSLESSAVDLEGVLGAAGVLHHRQRLVARQVGLVSLAQPNDFH